MLNRNLHFPWPPKLMLVWLFVANPGLAQTVPDIDQKQGRTDYIQDEEETGKPDKEIIFRNTMEFEAEFKNPGVDSKDKACEASLSVDYAQKETFLRVDAFLSNYTCGASRGSYEINVEYRDEKGESKSLTTTQAWQKSDDSDYAHEHRYPMSFDAEIIDVSGSLVSGDACFCTNSLTTESD